MDKSIKALLLILVVIIIFLGFIVKFTLDFDAKNLECVEDPLIFGAKKLAHVNSAKFSCTCGLDKPLSPLIYFDSDSESLRVEHPYSNNPSIGVDFSGILKIYEDEDD